MILAITRENEKLIYEVCKENGFEIPQILTGVDSLKRFAIQELKNLNNYKQKPEISFEMQQKFYKKVNEQ